MMMTEVNGSDFRTPLMSAEPSSVTLQSSVSYPKISKLCIITVLSILGCVLPTVSSVQETKDDELALRLFEIASVAVVNTGVNFISLLETWNGFSRIYNEKWASKCGKSFMLLSVFLMSILPTIPTVAKIHTVIAEEKAVLKILIPIATLLNTLPLNFYSSLLLTQQLKKTIGSFVMKDPVSKSKSLICGAAELCRDKQYAIYRHGRSAEGVDSDINSGDLKKLFDLALGANVVRNKQNPLNTFIDFILGSFLTIGWYPTACSTSTLIQDYLVVSNLVAWILTGVLMSPLAYLAAIYAINAKRDFVYNIKRFFAKKSVNFEYHWLFFPVTSLFLNAFFLVLSSFTWPGDYNYVKKACPDELKTPLFKAILIVADTIFNFLMVRECMSFIFNTLMEWLVSRSKSAAEFSTFVGRVCDSVDNFPANKSAFFYKESDFQDLAAQSAQIMRQGLPVLDR